MPGIPNPKANELIDALNEMSITPHLNEVSLRRIDREAQHLIRAGMVSYGYLVKGLVAATLWNIEDVDRCFNAAILNSDPENTVVTRVNYVAAMQRTLQLKRACQGAVAMANAYPDDLDVLSRAWSCCAAALDINGLNAIQDQRAALGVDQEVIDTSALVAVLRRRGSSIEALQERVACAAAALSRFRVRFHGADPCVLDTGECIYKFVVVTTPSEAAEMTFAIAESLAHAFDDPLDDVVSLGVVPFEEAVA